MVRSHTQAQKKSGMSTWTSKLALSASLFLAACQGTDLFAPATRTAPSEVLLPGNVVVTGPAGFCIDEVATRVSEAGAFILLGSCAAITRDGRQPAPENSAILAVSVRQGGAISLEDLEAVLDNSASIPGTPGTSLVEKEVADGAILLKTTDDRGEDWRALMPVPGGLISARVLSAPQKPVGPETSKAMLGELASALSRANAT